jgi:hypothetical protein
MSVYSVKKVTKLFKEFVAVLKNATDNEIIEILGNGAMDDFLQTILNPEDVKNSKSIADFFYKNKNRLRLLALTRHAITHNYAFKGTKDGNSGFVSPFYNQWYDDGVVFLEGPTPFEGYFGLYRNSKLSYAVAARNLRNGEKMKPEDFEFIDFEFFNKNSNEMPIKSIDDLEKPLIDLKHYLDDKNNDEATYQKFLTQHPWVLGLLYKQIQDHTNLDDKNIPDFTGLRANDHCNDIIEIKQPFTNIFSQDDEFSAYFNKSLNQLERYLNFSVEDKDYLRRKNIFCENPRGILIIGCNLTDQQIQKLRVKQRLNPYVTLWTYNDLYALTENTINIVKKIKEGSLNQSSTN